MKILIVGLGSMGKRRIRCLKALGNDRCITGFDIRLDRKEEARKLYNIEIIEEERLIDYSLYDCMIISVPPDHHNEYIYKSIMAGTPSFVEASVICDGLSTLKNIADEKNILIAPSCTMLFHPAIRDIKSIINSQLFGKVSNFSYQSGQYLPDWHPWEPISEYYVSQKQTGGAREIVPFELTWIVDIFGLPNMVYGDYGKTIDLGVDIDDTYNILLKYDGIFGNMLVDVVTRYATRHLIVNMENGQIIWDWNRSEIKVYDAVNTRWIIYGGPEGTSVMGYNKNIIEEMYINEIKAFLDSISNNVIFPNTLEKDIAILEILNDIERSTNE